MRFKKGSKVEVLSKKACVMGYWHCAEIISGNGHTYSVMFDPFPMTGDAVMDRVPRKAIRPCPPYVGGPDYWVPGDIVEVFDDLSWKTARVVKAMGWNNFLVRQLSVPSSAELRVHTSHIRVRQCWEDGKWFIVGGKGIESCTTSTIKNKTKKQYAGENYLLVEKNGSLEPQMISTIARKRGSPHGSSHDDSYPVAVQKMRRSIEVSGDFQIFPGHPFPSDEKVDASVSPQKILGGQYMHPSFNIGTTVGRGKPNWLSDSFGAGNLVPNDSDSCASSVASCSVTRSSPHYFPLNISRCDTDTESYCSDAESFCGRACEDEGCSPPPEELVGEVRRSELGVYRCIVDSLLAAGPFSWEEEGQLRHCNNFISTNSRVIIT